MIGDNGLGMLLQLIVGALVLFGVAAGGTWLVLSRRTSLEENGSQQIGERSGDPKAMGEESWGDEGGAGEVTNRRAA